MAWIQYQQLIHLDVKQINIKTTIHMQFKKILIFFFKCCTWEKWDEECLLFKTHIQLKEKESTSNMYIYKSRYFSNVNIPKYLGKV